MSFIGNKPATSFESPKKQVSTSNSGTTITLDYPVTSVADIRLTINAVVQSYDNYSVSGSTLTVGGTLNNDRVEILFVGRTYGSIAPSDASIVTNSLVDDAVTSSKLSSTAVDNTNTNSTLVTGQTAITSLADTDKFLVSDASDSGNLKYVEKQYLPSGGLVPVGQVDSGGNVGEVTLDNKFSATYTNYLIIVDKMTPATDGSNILFRFRDDTPSTISTSHYGLVSRGYRANDNGLSSRSGDGESTFQITDAGVANSSNKLGFKMAMWLHNPFTSTVYTATHGTFQYINNSGYSTGGYFQMQLHENSSPRGVVMYASSGNINGRIKAYGVVDS